MLEGVDNEEAGSLKIVPLHNTGINCTSNPKVGACQTLNSSLIGLVIANGYDLEEFCPMRAKEEAIVKLYWPFPYSNCARMRCCSLAIKSLKFWALGISRLFRLSRLSCRAWFDAAEVGNGIRDDRELG